MKCWLPFSCLSHTLLNTVDFIMQIQNTTVRPYTRVFRTSSPVHSKSNLDSTCDPRPLPSRLTQWCHWSICLENDANSQYSAAVSAVWGRYRTPIVLVGGVKLFGLRSHTTRRKKNKKIPGVYHGHCILFVSQFEYYIKNIARLLWHEIHVCLSTNNIASNFNLPRLPY